MKITFATTRLGRTLNNEAALVRKYGARGARKIQTRLTQLDAVNSLDEMRHLPGRCHELTGDRNGHVAVDVEHPQRLILVPSDNPPAQKADGGIDWSGVKAITIVEIDDYH